MASIAMITILIPTRNRADLAIAAARSVLGQAGGVVKLVISDNSSDPQCRNKLEEFCVFNGVDFIKTPEDLSMDQHWDWAFRQIGGYRYIGILTDRMVLYPGAIDELLSIICENNEPEVVSYNNDNVAYDSGVYVPIRREFSEMLISIRSDMLIESTANAKIATALPRALNCLVRVDVIDRLLKLSGRYFESIAPDFNFAFKLLVVVKEVSYYDKPLMISYGNLRSNGGGFTTGRLNRDSKDFLRFVSAGNRRLHGSPVPEVFQATNVVCHEYSVVRESFATSWPEAQKMLWISLVASRVRDSDGELSSKWRSALIEKYEVSPVFFQDLSASSIKQKIKNLVVMCCPRLIVFWGRWAGKVRYINEADALDYLVNNRVRPTKFVGQNMDF